MYRDSYQQLDELEQRWTGLRKEYQSLADEVLELMNELEVEQFLQEGPGGEDP